MKSIETFLKATAIIAMLIASLTAQAADIYNQDTERITRMEVSESNPDLKPVIDSISDLTYNFDEYEFSIEFTVYFHGTDRIHVELEEDGNTSLRDYIFDGTSYDDIYMAHVKTGRLSRLVYSWVTILASNEYGTTRHTIETPPFFTEDAVEEVKDQTPVIDVDGTTVLIKCNSELNVSVVSLDGRIIYNDRISHDTEIPLVPGIFIVTCGNQNTSYSKKILIR